LGGFRLQVRFPPPDGFGGILPFLGQEIFSRFLEALIQLLHDSTDALGLRSLLRGLAHSQSRAEDQDEDADHQANFFPIHDGCPSF